MSNPNNMPANVSEFLIYQTEDGRTRVETRLTNETVWLTLNQTADLFQRDKSVISRHIRNVFEEGELGREGVVAEFAATAADGKVYRVDYYNLDVILSVGYRVKSHRGVQFRIWATQRLEESSCVIGPANVNIHSANPPSLCLACSIPAGLSFFGGSHAVH